MHGLGGQVSKTSKQSEDVMSIYAAEENLRASLAKLVDLDEQLRERAFRSVDAYVQYIYATATGGAGPIAVPPAPSGSTSTTGTFKCPKCGHNGTSIFR